MLSTVSLTAMGLILATATPQLLVLPPKPNGIKEIQAIDAWEIVTAEFRKRQKKLGVSMTLQRSAQGILLGMGKKTSWNCKMKVSCLSNLGEDLDAQYLVAGVISPEKITMMIVDVKKKKRFLRIRAGKKLAKKSLKDRVRLISKALTRGFEKKLKRKSSSGKSLSAKSKKGKKRKKAKALAAKKKQNKTNINKKRAKKVPSIDKTATAQTPKVATTSPPPKPKAPEPPPQMIGSLDGMIQLSAKQLEGVTSIKVDGMSVMTRGDGTAIWMGAPGMHNLVVKRNDGAVARAELIIDPRQIVKPELAWKNEAVTEFTGDFSNYEVKRPNWEKWWFWASIGGALVAGTVTAGILLDGGLGLGGPDVAGPTGTVAGTY